MSTVPYLPENAPFSADQRAWLNGFLAGLYSNASAGAAPAAAKASLKVAVLYASQTGTGEGLAKKVAKELKAKGHQPQIASLEGYAPASLAKETHAVLIASTYGEGDPPDPAKGFYDLLLSDAAPRLDKLEYTVLALGDRNYEHFCKFGVDLDNRLTTLGGARMFPVVQSDVEVDEPFARWKAALLRKLEEETTAGSVSAAVKAEPIEPKLEAGTEGGSEALPPARVHVHTRSNPYFAPLVEKRALTDESSSKQTLHLAFSLADSEVHYEAGDACAVVPNNDPELVGEILAATGLLGSEEVRIGPADPLTIHAALSHGLFLTRLDRKVVQAFAAKGEASKLLDLLRPERSAELERYVYDRGVIDLLHEFPGVITNAVDLVSILPKLTPRLYSISSSPAAHAGEVHSTVAVVRYTAHDRERGGICSTMLADRTGVGDRLPIYIQPNKKFRLPAAETPLIMIGPGTGVAPFRSFLHERRALGAKGKNWLFFGERSAATDFLYREELTAMCDDGHLTRLDTAFSRDQAEKIYVQDRMREHGKEFWKWLNEGAGVYVCGDASRMAKDVDAALHALVAQHGAMSEDAAQEYVTQLHEDRRYHRDVY